MPLVETCQLADREG